MSILVILLCEPQKALELSGSWGVCWEKRPVCSLPGRASSSLPEPVPLSGFSGFHRPEQTSLPWLTRFSPACWKSSSLCLASLTTHHSSWSCSKTLRLSAQTVSTHSPAAARLSYFSLKPSHRDLGCSPALGLLVCHSTGHLWSIRSCPTTVVGAPRPAAGDCSLFFTPLPTESRGHRQPAHKGSLCKMTFEPENPPCQALRAIRSTIPINRCDRHA